MADAPRTLGDVDLLFSSAEEELSAFFRAVDQLLGTEQARRSAFDWIHEMEVMNWPDGEAFPNWREVTIRVSARLWSRNQKRDPIPDSVVPGTGGGD